jgi:predicted  nucleic acid-binding Zn-ribbon protein
LEAKSGCREALDSEIKDTIPVIKDYSPREIQRQRKVAEGELRNKYFREASPLKKRIAEIESELANLEVEFKDLETYFATLSVMEMLLISPLKPKGTTS